MGSNNEIDFDWGEDGIPSAADVTAYYQAHHARATDMYREVGTALSVVGAADSSGQSYTTRFTDAARSATLIALGSVSAPEVEIDTGFWGTDVTVTITHALPLTGVLAYLGYEGGTTIRTAAYTYSVNPSEFVRNVDLAADLLDHIMKKCGLSQSYHEFLGKTDEVLSLIL